MSSSGKCAGRVDIIGAGTFSPHFDNWATFCSGIAERTWLESAALQPELIPPRERRRAPDLVKMAIEVMTQASQMAQAKPDDAAIVFSSAMGDMQITDYLCRVLAETPEAVSPTRFHNSVHNAAPGYWSIATGSCSGSNAISAFEYTSCMALLEACVQVVIESQSVLLVTQEVAATRPLADICRAETPYSACLLLAPATKNRNDKAMATLEFELQDETCAWPALRDDLKPWFDSNINARLLPLMSALAALHGNDEPANFRFPLSAFSSLNLTLKRAAGEC